MTNTPSALHNRPPSADPRGQNGVFRALRAVDDPEYPGVSIVDLGLVHDVRIDGARVEVDLLPTFSGCPALDMIAADVRRAIARVAGAGEAVVRFVPSPPWTPERISPLAEARLAAEFGVAVARPGRSPECPRCATSTLVEESVFGPVRCRSIHRCTSCGERVEVIR